MADKNEKIIDDFFDKSNKTVENLIIDLRPQDNQINEQASIANRFDIVARARLAAEKFYENLNLKFKNDKNIVFGDTITPNGVDRQTAFKLVLDKNNQIRLDRQITETKPGLLYGNTKKETNESAVLTPDQLARFKGLDRIEQLSNQQRANQINAVAATQELIIKHVQFKQQVEKSIQGLEPVKDGNKRAYDKAVEAAGKTIKADLEKTLKALEGPMANLYTDPKVAREKAVEQIDSLSKTAVAVTPAISKVDFQREFADLANRSAAPDAAGITPQRSEEDLRKRLADAALRVEIGEIARRPKIDLGGLDEAGRDLSDYYKNNPANRPADFSSGALIEQASKDAREKIVKQVELALSAAKPVVQNDIAQSQARAQSSGADDLISRIRAGAAARDARDANPNLRATIEPEGKHINELRGNAQAVRSGQEPKSPEAVLSEKLHAAAREVALNENAPTKESQDALNKAAQDLVKYNQENGTGIRASAEQVAQNAVWLEAARITKEQAAPSKPQPTIVALPQRPEGKVENATAAVPTPTVPAANAVTPEPIAAVAADRSLNAQPEPAPAAAKPAVEAATAAPIAANTAGSEDPRRAAVRPELEAYAKFVLGGEALREEWKDKWKASGATDATKEQSNAARANIKIEMDAEFKKFSDSIYKQVKASFPGANAFKDHLAWRTAEINKLKDDIQNVQKIPTEVLKQAFEARVAGKDTAKAPLPVQPAATRQGAAAATAATPVPSEIALATARQELIKFEQFKQGGDRLGNDYKLATGISTKQWQEALEQIEAAKVTYFEKIPDKVWQDARKTFSSDEQFNQWKAQQSQDGFKAANSEQWKNLRETFLNNTAGTPLAEALSAKKQIAINQAATAVPTVINIPTPAGTRGAAATPAATGQSNPEANKKAAIAEIEKFIQMKGGADLFKADYPTRLGVSAQDSAEVVDAISTKVDQMAANAEARIRELVGNSFPSAKNLNSWIVKETSKATTELQSQSPENLKAKFLDVVAGTELAARLASQQANTLQAATSTPRAATAPVAPPAAGNAKRTGLDDDDLSAAGKPPAQVKPAAAPVAPLKPTPPIAANNGKPVTLDSLIDDMFAKRAAPPVQTAAATNETTPKLTRAETEAIDKNLDHIAAYLEQNPTLDRRPIERPGLAG